MSDPTVISTTQPALRRCPTCNGVLDAGPGPLAGLCSRCLYGVGLGEEVEPVSASTDFAGYQILAKLGQGAMGTVYLAYDPRLDRRVAIKCLRAGAPVDGAEKRRLRREGKLIAKLNHPHIVRVHRLDEHQGQPFIVMDYLPKGSLRDRLRDPDTGAGRRLDPAIAATIVAKVARGVHAAHEQKIIHRDNKPDNILFDEHDEPQVSDFGVARYVGATNSASLTVAGTVAYMSPEQALGDDEHPTVDVWAIGVTLYEMIGGRRPFDGPTVVEVIRSAAHDTPEPLAGLTSPRDRDIATVALTCLEKDPAHRYRSALDLAEDLERCLAGESPRVRRPGRALRAWRWSLRHPATAALFAAAVSTLIALSLWGAWTGLAQAAARRDEVLANNVFSARAVAAMVLLQLQEYADVVQREARDRELGAALAAAPRCVPPAGCKDDAVQAIAVSIHVRSRAATPGLAYWFVLDVQGHLRAHFPEPKIDASWARDFSFRDYVRGASEQHRGARREVYVSRAFIAGTDGKYKIAIVSPIRDASGAVLGLLAAEMVTDSHFGALTLGDARHLTALTVRHDRESKDAPLPDDHLILAHDGVEHGEGVRIENAAINRLAARRTERGIHRAGDDQLHLPPADLIESDGDYHDPLSPRDPSRAEGPFLAGIAPVGDTELAVVVETRSEAALAIDHWPVRVLVAWSVIGAALVFAGLFSILRTSRGR